MPPIGRRSGTFPPCPSLPITTPTAGLPERLSDADSAGDIQVIPTHRTEPLGHGEGGLLILPVVTRGFAQNGKLPDISAAAIVDLLQRIARRALPGAGTTHAFGVRQCRPAADNRCLGSAPRA